VRILVATNHRSIQGGIEKYVQTLIPALSKRHQVALLCENDAPAGAETVDQANSELAVWAWRELLKAPPRWQEIAGWKPDLVYSQGLESPAAERALLERYPVVSYAHVYSGTCASGQKCHAFPHPRPCSRRFGPACLALYYPRRCGGLHPLRAIEMYRMNAQRNELLGRYNSILVASTHMYREYQQHGVSAEKLQLVPLPVTEIGAGGRPELTQLTGSTILFVGRLTKLKGVDYLIRAIPKAAQSLGWLPALTVVGDGPERSGLAQLAKGLGVQAQFTGWLDSEQKQQAMRQADLLAVPSLWPEPFGLVGIEAGRMGMPAVGFAVGGIPDWLIPGQTGEIAPGDPPAVEGLAAAIVRAWSSPERFSQLRRGAFELSRRFTLEKHLAQLEQVLSAACGAPVRQPDMVDITS
jgi:glycosyltransferase involved in cell wall biosynthesis